MKALPLLTTLVLILPLSPGLRAKETDGTEKNLEQSVLEAFQDEDYTRAIGLIEKAPEAKRETDDMRLALVTAYQRRGEQRFFNGEAGPSVADFDRVLELAPGQAPYHWQRGISCYYAEQYQAGKEQFELHQTVNSQDVENAVWHFLCHVRAPGGSVEKARQDFIGIQQDLRVPMKEIHALFAGTGSPEAVLESATKDADPEEMRDQLCYAHLYLGLYQEAVGEPEKSLEHMRLAATTYKMDHYMGKVAQVHYQLRNQEAPQEEGGAAVQ